MMTFLKKFGVILASGLKIATGIGPFIPQLSPNLNRISDTLTRLADIIISIEAFAAVLGIPGPDKLKAATPAIVNILLQSDMLTGKKIKNPALLRVGAEKIANGLVDVLNSVDEEEARSEPIG